MVLLIIIPFLNGYFIGKINPTFSSPNPYLITEGLPHLRLSHPSLGSSRWDGNQAYYIEKPPARKDSNSNYLKYSIPIINYHIAIINYLKSFLQLSPL